MTGGYLLSSRAAYSENAVLTEHFTRHSDFGVDYFTVTAIVEDGAADAHLELDVQEGAERLEVQPRPAARSSAATCRARSPARPFSSSFFFSSQTTSVSPFGCSIRMALEMRSVRVVRGSCVS